MTRRRAGAADQAARRALAAQVAAGLAVCPRCLEPITPGQAWDAGHVDDLGTGGHRAGPVRPEHATCNRSAGGRLGNEIRRARRGRRRLGEWTTRPPGFSGDR